MTFRGPEESDSSLPLGYVKTYIYLKLRNHYKLLSLSHSNCLGTRIDLCL